MIRKLFFCFLMILAPHVANALETVSIEDLRARLVGQKVIMKKVVDPAFPSIASAWKMMDFNGTNYFEKTSSKPSLSMNDAAGEIVFIDSEFYLNEKRNPFGDAVQQPSQYNPSIFAVVRLVERNEYIAIKDKYRTIINDYLVLESERSGTKSAIEDALSGLLGKQLYLYGETPIYMDALSEADLNDGVALGKYRDWSHKRSEPVQLVKFKYNEISKVLILLVSNRSGERRLVFGKGYRDLNISGQKISSILNQFRISANTSIPQYFNKLDIEAINRGVPIEGMNELALFWAKGNPSSIDSLPNGVTQYLYSEGAPYVIFTKNNRVVQVQFLGD